MLLETERLSIRYIEDLDWEMIQKIWENINQTEYAKYDVPKDTEPEAVRTRITKWAKANNGMDHLFFAVCLNNIVIGYIAFNLRIDSYEIGYCFHSDYHGKGYAKESHLALIEYIHHNLGIKKLTAGTAIDNTPSVKLLESLGFKLIGKEKVSFYKDEDGNDIVFDGGLFELILEDEL